MNATKMPATEKDVADKLRYFSADYCGDQTFCLIEKVHAMPGQGVTSMFTFGMNYGALRMALVCHGIPFEAVTPQKWQREFGLVFPRKLGLTPTEKKNRHKARAQELFPSLKVTHATADALLICEYGRRVRNHP